MPWSYWVWIFCVLTLPAIWLAAGAMEDRGARWALALPLTWMLPVIVAGVTGPILRDATGLGWMLPVLAVGQLVAPAFAYALSTQVRGRVALWAIINAPIALLADFMFVMRITGSSI